MTVILDQFLQTLSESGLMTAEEAQQLIRSLPDDQKPQSGEGQGPDASDEHDGHDAALDGDLED